ncbi:MAG: pilus assembly protein PilM [Bryobacterales bacterium]
MNLKPIFRLGSGCGIDIHGEQLCVVAVKSRPAGVTVLGATNLDNFRHRPPHEWGAEYASFLKDHGLTHLSATVALPRDEVIVRQLLLPPVSGKELAAAVRYQLDALHPFPEDEVYHAFAPLREPGEGTGQLPVAVAIAEKSRVDGYAGLFESAGIAVAAFTVSDAALAAALRVRWNNPPRPFVIAHFRNGSMEVYGEAEERPLWTTQFDLATMSPARALQVAAAELRLDPAEPAALVVCGDSISGRDTSGPTASGHNASRADAEIDLEAEPSPADKLTAAVPAAFQLRSVAEMLPSPIQSPAGFDLRADATAFAVALESACPRLGWRANLLPEERRKTDSRWMYAPTAALAAALLLLAVAFAVRPVIQDRSYLAAVEAESARFEQTVQNVEQAEEQSGFVRRRLARLQSQQQRAEADLRILRELSELVPDNVWLRNVEINDNGALLAGQAPAAAPLLGVLDAAANLTDASFTSSLVKSGSGEMFQIGVRRSNDDSAKTAPAPAAAAASPAAQPPPAAREEASETLNTVSGEEPAATEGNN